MDCPRHGSEPCQPNGAVRLRSGQPLPHHYANTETQARARLAMRGYSSLTFTRIAFDFDRNHCLIVERVYAGGVLGYGLEDFVDYAVGRLGGATGDDCFHALLPKGVAVAVAGIENTVADKYEQ